MLGLRLAAPAAEIELPPLPASAAGPGLRQLLIGSEGTLGVITELPLRVRPAPQERLYEGVFFEDFAAGAEALRKLAREHALPDVARLSDEQETRMSLALAGTGGLKRRLGRAYLQLRGYRGGCLAILGFEGAGEESRAGAGARSRWCARAEGSPSGARPARRGCTAASPHRTCATSCSRTASWSRRSRPPRSGRRWRDCTARSARRSPSIARVRHAGPRHVPRLPRL